MLYEQNMFLTTQKLILENETQTGLNRKKMKLGPAVKTRTGFLFKPGQDRTGKIKTRTGGDYPDRKK